MHKFRFDCRGPDCDYLARLLVFTTALFGMDVFKKFPENLSEALIRACVARYQASYEGGKYGDRNWIARRKEAKKDAKEMTNRILRFLEVVAEDKDAIILQNAGVLLGKSPGRGAGKQVVPSPAE